jgi:hypothetical protein
MYEDNLMNLQFSPNKNWKGVQEAIQMPEKSIF